ncbi:MAG: ABC transporter ATP-binding protein [Prevotella sp.]|nr:ABC transporter ATP-binding protein [Prevotella sp.]
MSSQRTSFIHWLNPESKYSALQIFRWLWKVWKGHRLQATLNACIGLTGVGFSLTMVWAMKRAIDTATGAREGSIYTAVGVMAAITLCEFAVGISRVWVKNILGVKARNRMQQLTLARLLRSEWRGREAMHSGDVINRLETDVNRVVEFLTETMPSTLSTVALFIGAFVYLLQMDEWLAIITVGILPLFILVSRFYVAKMRQLSRKVRESDSFIQSLLTETMHHRMLIKTMEADGQMLDRLEDTQSGLRERVKKRTAFSVASHLFLNTGFSLGYLIAFLWGLIRLHDGTITFGAMTAFLQLVYRIQGPARDLTRLAPAFVSVLTSAERLMELEEIPEEQQGEALMMAAPCGVRFTDVSYRYTPQQRPTVLHANYDFPPGSCTAILGETGAGKTTLIRLLLALIRPQEGEITIYSGESRECRVESVEFATAVEEANGAVANSPLSTRHSPLSSLHRCNFVYVPQGNTLLSGTLRDNLRIGAPDATDAQMHEALRLACADFVSELPDGLDTKFAEQGGGLSEGQAQRIAIARALLRPGSIILLDEATSALDADTERQLLDNILRDQRKTVIFVTHRQAVIEYCDRVIRID